MIVVYRELEESLTGRVIAASGEVVRKLHNVKDAQVGRDAFAKVNFNKRTMSKKKERVRRERKLSYCNFRLIDVHAI